MKDSEVRGLILQKLYDARHDKHQFVGVPEGLAIKDIDNKVLGNVTAQLEQQGLIEFKQTVSTSYRSGIAWILAPGVDVVEGTTAPPIAITFDHSINVSGSQGVQIGGQGNTQTTTIDVEKMINAVENGAGSFQEKEEAKSLITKLMENPLAKAAIGWLLKSQSGA